MAQAKKYYPEEVITLHNGDEATARNLPISKLKVFHEEYKKWTDHTTAQRKIFNALEEEAKEKAQGDEEKAEKILEALLEEEDKRNEDGLTYVDVASKCALIALQCWRIRASNGKTVDPDAIDLEYVQDNADMVTLDRILQVAGAMTTGDVNELEGKPRG